MGSLNRNGRPLGTNSPTTDVVLRVRNTLRLTQEEMARELNCSLDTVRKLERYQRLPSHLAIKVNFAALAQRAGIEVPNSSGAQVRGESEGQKFA